MIVTIDTFVDHEEMIALNRILKALGDKPTDGVSVKITTRSRLEMTMVYMRIKDTAKVEMRLELSPELFKWAADAVDLMAPLINKLIQQLKELHEAAFQSVLSFPEDSKPDTVIEYDTEKQ